MRMQPLSGARLPDGFTASVFRAGLAAPRGLLVSASGDLLVVERGGVSRIRALWDTDGDGISSDSETAVLADSASELNHGIAYSAGYLYASSDTTVYRWAYDGHKRSSLGMHETVIANMNANGAGGAPSGHTTRTLAFDGAGNLYVSVGSYSNVDSSSFRARVRRFDSTLLQGTFSAGSSLDFLTGFVWADGLRNEGACRTSPPQRVRSSQPP